MEVRANEEARYDLFVSYAMEDQQWVDGFLIDALRSAGVRYHSEATFTLGVPRITEFERAVRESRRTLLVLSPAYLARDVDIVDVLAQSYGAQTSTWPVIPLLLHDVELPPRLAMLEGLDAKDPERWQAAVNRLCEQLGSGLPSVTPKPPCPYPGMLPFSEADSERFYGRDKEVEEALQQLRLHPFLVVIGPSGSGKSSLVFAGLVPALRQSGLFGTGGWLVRAIRPGEMPLETLAGAIGGDANSPHRAVQRLLASEPDAHRLLLIVDQFEEVFTRRPEDGTAFQQALLRLAGASDCYVVVTGRADFYSDLMASPLWPQIQAHRFEVLPLSADGMRQAIRGPAASADGGVFVDPALVERLVTDVAGEPGSLPMAQEALVLAWERLERRYLPLSAYETLGEPGRTGLQVAMARRADAVLAALTEEQQAIARRIFLRLVQFGEGRADTRRQQPEASLSATGDDPGALSWTVNHLADNRLLTTTGEERGPGRRVDIAHEALIQGWPRLQEWLGKRREAEQTRRRLEDKAVEWVRLGQGGGGLLDEVELLEAERWLEGPDATDLGYSEVLSRLLRASREAVDRAEQEREEARRQELERAKMLAEAQGRVAEEQRRRAEAALLLYRASLARTLASEAEGAATKELALLLAAEALDLSPDYSTDHRLRALILRNGGHEGLPCDDSEHEYFIRTRHRLTFHDYIRGRLSLKRWIPEVESAIELLGTVVAASYAPVAGLLAVATAPEATTPSSGPVFPQSGLVLYEVAGEVTKTEERRLNGSVLCLTVSAGGDVVAAAVEAPQRGRLSSTTGYACTYRVSHSLEETARYRQTGFIEDIAFDGTTERLVTLSHNGIIRVWNLRSQSQLCEAAAGLPADTVEFTSDGSYVMVGKGQPVTKIPITSEALAERARQIAGRTLTSEERDRYIGSDGVAADS